MRQERPDYLKLYKRKRNHTVLLMANGAGLMLPGGTYTTIFTALLIKYWNATNVNTEPITRYGTMGGLLIAGACVMFYLSYRSALKAGRYLQLHEDLSP